MMADAFASSASIAAMACSWVSLEPLALAHRATSSIAATNAYWLCSRRVNTSAVAIWASELSGMAVVLEGGRGCEMVSEGYIHLATLLR